MTVSFQAKDYSNGYDYKKDVRGGGIAALIAGSTVKIIPQIPMGKKLLPKMQKIHTYTPEEVTQIRNAAQQILKNRGLVEKGVKIKYLSEETLATPKSFLEGLLQSLNPINMIKAGQNAAFTGNGVKGLDTKTLKEVLLEEGNTVLMPEHNLQGSIFHEIGHADNYNNGKILKLLQKCRPISVFLPSFLLLYGAFSKKSRPKDGETELTKGQKANNFIRDNAGKLSFAAMLPMLIEEASATIKGKKFAENLVSKDIAKKATKGNWLGFVSYACMAVFAGLAARTAVKIKDRKIEKKELEIKGQLSLDA